MPETVVIGQKRVLQTIAGAVGSNRVPHAYLFFGPDGVGKRAVAIELAAALLCSSPSEGMSCGRCSACTRVRRLGHPDVKLMMPVPKDTPVEAISERLQLLAGDPYATVDFERRPTLDSIGGTSNKQVMYSVDTIGKDLRREMSFKPVEGGYKVAILTDADRLRTEAANAFLKLLEEPGSKTVFVLTSDRPNRLLPTVRSRCQMLRFDRLPDEEIASAIAERLNLPSSTAKAVARMADGSYSRAVDLASSEELFSTRSAVLEFMRAAYTGDGVQVVDHAERLQRMGREPLKFFLQLILGWLRDLLLYRSTGDKTVVVNLDQIESIHSFCRRLPQARLESMIDLVEEASDLVERNVNVKLCFIVLAQELGSAMRGNPVGGLVVSLSDEPLIA